MRLLLIILFSLIGLTAYSQTYSRDGLGIKWIQLEGCRKVSNGQPGDSCFVMTNGINGKLSRCLHISELRALITGGVGPTDSTYLIDNGDGSYSLFNENGTEYPFGYKFEEVGDTIFLTDLDGHRADTLVMSLLDNQTLSWDPGTGNLGIANGNTVNLDGRYLITEVDGDPTNELQFIDSFYTSNDSLFISLDRDSVAPSFVVLNPGADGNGIYGGDGEVPDSTLAHVGLTNDFAIGHFRGFPDSVTLSDRGLWLSDDEFYLYANDSAQGGLARIYSSNLDLEVKSSLGTDVSYLHVDPDMAILFSEDMVNATNITATSDSLDMYSRLWTPEFDSARLRLETTYGNAGDVLTSDGLNMRWAAPSGGGNGIYGGSDMVPDQTYAQIGTEAPHSNIAQDSVFAIGYHPNFPTPSPTNSRGLFWDATASGFYIFGADTVNNSYTYSNYTSGQYTTSRNSSTGEISEVNIGPAFVNYDVYDNTDTSMIDIVVDSIYALSDRVNIDADTFRLKIGGTYGTNGYVLTSDGINAEWAAATGGAQANAINLSGNVITSNVDGQIDTTLAIGNNTLSYATSTKILTSSVNGVSDTTTLTGLGDILNGGNTTGATVVIGTNDAFGLDLETNNVTRMSITGGASTGGDITTTEVTTATNAIDRTLTMRLNSTGTAAANFGPGVLFQAESSTTDNQDLAAIDAYWTTATHATREGAISLKLGNAGGALTETFKLDRADLGGLGQFTLGTSTPVVVTPTSLTVGSGNDYTFSTTKTGGEQFYFYADTSNVNADGAFNVSLASFRTGGGFYVENLYQNTGSATSMGAFNGYSDVTTLGSGAYLSLRNSQATDNVSNEIRFNDNSGGPSALIRAKYTNRTSNYGDLSFATRSASGYNEKIYILSTGQIGFGNSAPTSPTAWINIAAGTATASTAPLKFTSGTNLTSAEAGAVEYDGTNYFMTNSTPTRCTVMKALVGSGTLDFGNTAAQNSADLTITVTGAADGEEVILGVPNAAVNANSAYTAWVSAANTVTVRFNNYSAAPINPASATFKVSVIKR